MVRMLAAAALLVLAVDTEETDPTASPVAVPNVHQLAYQELELGVLIQYNIGGATQDTGVHPGIYHLPQIPHREAN